MEIQSAVELLTVEDAGTNNARPNNAGTIYDDLSDAEEEENGWNNAGVFVNLIYPWYLVCFLMICFLYPYDKYLLI